jgi:hypothetical protein
MNLILDMQKKNGNEKALVERKDHLSPLLRGIFRASEGLGGVH